MIQLALTSEIEVHSFPQRAQLDCLLEGRWVGWYLVGWWMEYNNEWLPDGIVHPKLAEEKTTIYC